MTATVHHIDGCDIAFDAWEHLESVFGAQARCFKYSLLIKFFTLTLQKGDALSSHLNSMKSLLTQLASIKINLDEDIVIAVLLKSLTDEHYSNVITTLTKFLPLNLLMWKLHS